MKTTLSFTLALTLLIQNVLATEPAQQSVKQKDIVLDDEKSIPLRMIDDYENHFPKLGSHFLENSGYHVLQMTVAGLEAMGGSLVLDKIGVFERNNPRLSGKSRLVRNLKFAGSIYLILDSGMRVLAIAQNRDPGLSSLGSFAIRECLDFGHGSRAPETSSLESLTTDSLLASLEELKKRAPSDQLILIDQKSMNSIDSEVLASLLSPKSRALLNLERKNAEPLRFELPKRTEGELSQCVTPLKLHVASDETEKSSGATGIPAPTTLKIKAL